MTSLTDNNDKKEVLPRVFDPYGIEREKLNCIIAQTEALYDIKRYLRNCRHFKQ